jgi:hypothetical protein
MTHPAQASQRTGLTHLQRELTCVYFVYFLTVSSSITLSSKHTKVTIPGVLYLCDMRHYKFTKLVTQARIGMNSVPHTC